jgi:hypothetical protein
MRQVAEMTQEEEDILAQMEEDHDDAQEIELTDELRQRMQSEVPPSSCFNSLGEIN